MARLDALVALAVTDADPLAQQPVVLEVVHRLEKREADHRLQHQVGDDGDPQPQHDRSRTGPRS